MGALSSLGAEVGGRMWTREAVAACAWLSRAFESVGEGGGRLGSRAAMGEVGARSWANEHQLEEMWEARPGWLTLMLRLRLAGSAPVRPVERERRFLKYTLKRY